MNKIAFILAFSLLGFSCSSLLEVVPSNNLSGDLYTNQDNIEQALNGVYFNLGGINDGEDGGELFGGDLMLIPALFASLNQLYEVRWDDIKGASYSDFIDKNVNAINGRVESNWRRAFEILNTINAILQNVNNISNASAKARIQGEALAIRGILYFEMVRLWAPEYQTGTAASTEGLPLLLQPVESPGVTPTFNTVQEIYSQVREDLLEASELLETFGKNETRISYYACQTYLMRKHMHENDYDSAILHATNIIDANVYTLADTPNLAFNNSSNSTEDIFAIQQTDANNAGNTSTGTGATNFYSSLTNQGIGAMRVSQFFLTPNDLNNYKHGPEFDSLDLRWGIDSLTSTSTVDDISSGFYVNVLNTGTLSPSKFAASNKVIPVIRYAEILLTRAEALAFQNAATVNNTALADYNAIRDRAGLPELMASDFAIGVDLYDSILVERRREFLFEGHLYHDLKRRDRKLANESVNQDKFILPIPQSEIDAGFGN